MPRRRSRSCVRSPTVTGSWCCARLVEGEISAGDLSRRLGLTQSNLSRHLGTLREEGLVATRREATTIYYRIASDRVRTILQTLHGMFCAGPGIC